ncbi:probable LRR receptor-like serine/threonine-protein kinase At1g07650 isoform X1 [Magnolia sinica]|uniref:probable LRR receptor-like serine/threonine-protein kinase At1g07650 isoform X1 n=1 Tax=Magnolia sinica TaxID=86752 RepID=UPI002659D6A5|nr:probable LRR receptor-like serine/threonine-protein kinase At1g07650 isoform X1 [Magnolia sinica]
MERRDDVVSWKLFATTLKILVVALNIFQSQAGYLPQEEIEALRVIGPKLGKTDWNFSVDPCIEGNGWTTPNATGFENDFGCSCDPPSGCHVVSIILKSQNLSGVLPPELARLRFLHNLDLTRNLLSGPIPPEWATLPLTGISLMANRLTGPIPKEIGNIATLQYMNLEANGLSGLIPPELGNLINLEELSLSSNRLTGELPIELARLTNLVDFRISDNNFSGKLPDFIQNWKQLKTLRIQGTSLEGPIPSRISSLKNLFDLRISDLSGMGSDFPLLSEMVSMKTLILRNCLIHGHIPEYIGNMRDLRTLDLSFNNLTGNVPISLEKLQKLDFMFLTSNRLAGPIPYWILKTNRNVDLSYNDFTPEKLITSQCQLGNVNLFASHSLMVNSTYTNCLEDNSRIDELKPHYHSSLYINCGGEEIVVDGNTYEADVDPQGASLFILSGNWAFSSTGNFMDDRDGSYIVTNTTTITAPSPGLYTTARVSPISLTYYGLHLINGDYVVRLHFAEIIFTNKSTFNGLGKRLFNVHIQRKMALKDFNIEDEAGGPSKPIVKSFTATVINHTLEISFYWAGKGTQAIPRKGVYGVLISAISVEPVLHIPHGLHKLSTKIVVGIVALVAACFTLLVGGILWRKHSWRSKFSNYQGMRSRLNPNGGSSPSP